MRLGFFEILAIFAIILLILGPKQIPKLTKAVKDSVKSMKKEFDSEDKEDVIEEKTDSEPVVDEVITEVEKDEI